MWAHWLRKTSEYTVTVNLLDDIAYRLGQHLKRHITIICPTPHEEKKYGPDAIIESLPAPGRVFAVQFKRPFEGNACAAKFTVREDQYNALRNNFNKKEAFYVFSPYPLTADFVAQRASVLSDSAFVDVHALPWLKSTASKTVKYKNPAGSHQIEITDPRRYVPVSEVSTWEEMQENIDEIGREVKRKKDIDEITEQKKKGIGKTFYVYISGDEHESSEFRQSLC
jgi:hypothetical protein